MNNFTYYTPTKVVFEKGAENLAGQMLCENNAKKVLIHYGSDRIVKSGLLDKVTSSIKAMGIEYFTLGGVVANPLLSKVYEGIDIVRKEGIDFILAVGGGSTIDSSKAIAMGAVYDGDVWDFFDDIKSPSASLPVACVLTLAGAGSEMSSSCVITKEEGKLKRYTGHPDCICKFALMNPELMLTLPDYQTASGCTDMLMHTMERYLSRSEHLDITDKVSEGVMKSIILNAKKLKDNPKDLEARANIMWAGSLAHNTLTGCGTDGGDWATHNIEHELGGMFDVTHGAGLSAIWGSFARYVIDIIPDRLAKLATDVFDLTPQKNEKDTALMGIDAMEGFYRYIGMPVSLNELGIHPDDAQIDELALKATHYGRIRVGKIMPLDKQDIINILTSAKGSI